jgi:SAM-dependent methyltransferase
VIDAAASQSSHPSPTRSDLLRHVGATSADNYLYGGLTSASGVRAVATALGSPPSKATRILDWGCSSGRVIRWFGDVRARTELVGTDINDVAVRWCQKNLPLASFRTNRHRPPLPFPDEHFDLVYGISVLTHLDQDFERAWLAEIWRVSRPEALILLSVHGEDWAEHSLDPAELAEFGRRGFLYKRAGPGSIEGLPDFYQLAFHSRRYIERTWARLFDVLMYVNHGPLYAQQLVALRKGRGSGWLRLRRPRRPVEFDLPIGALDQQAVGTVMNGPAERISGWAFFPSGEKAHLRLWVDGRPVAEFSAGRERPEIGTLFPNFATAGRSGFESTLDLRGLHRGLHSLWLTSQGGKIPIGTTYFTVA